jgi:HK97 family phage major capsid protein
MLDTIPRYGDYNALRETNVRARAFSAAVRDLVIRAAIPPMTGASESALTDPKSANAFLDLVRAVSVLGRLREVLRVPSNTLIPRVGLGFTASWSGGRSLKPIPLTKGAFDNVLLAPTAMGTIVVFSDELAKVGGDRATTIVETQLRRAVVVLENATLLSAAVAVPDESPAGLLNGVTSSGTGAAGAIDAEIAALFASVRDGAPDAPYFVASKAGALYLSGLRSTSGAALYPDARVDGGGHLHGVPLLVAAEAGTKLILVDAAAVVVADDGIEVARSTETALEMADTGLAVPPTGPTRVSLWQNDLTAIRATRFVTWVKGFDDAAGFLTLPIGS